MKKLLLLCCLFIVVILSSFVLANTQCSDDAFCEKDKGKNYGCVKGQCVDIYNSELCSSDSQCIKHFGQYWGCLSSGKCRDLATTNYCSNDAHCKQVNPINPTNSSSHNYNCINGQCYDTIKTSKCAKDAHCKSLGDPGKGYVYSCVANTCQKNKSEIAQYIDPLKEHKIKPKQGLGSFLRNVFTKRTNFCSDTDGGFNLTTPGTITGLSRVAGNKTSSYREQCATGMFGGQVKSGPYVWETECTKDGFISVMTHKCPFGCIDGFCKQTKTCYDTDGGFDLYTQGNITGLNRVKGGKVDSQIEQCATGRFGGQVKNGTHVWESECTKDGYMSSMTYECPNGCVDGACVKKEKKQTQKRSFFSFFKSLFIGEKPEISLPLDEIKPPTPLPGQKVNNQQQATCVMKCKGDTLIDCVNGKETPIDCKKAFLGNDYTCVDINGPVCAPKPNCTPKCDGDVSVECLNGKENRIDCPKTFGDSSYSCSMINGNPSCVPKQKCVESCAGRGKGVNCVNNKEFDFTCKSSEECKVSNGKASCVAKPCVAECSGSKVAVNCKDGKEVNTKCVNGEVCSFDKKSEVASCVSSCKNKCDGNSMVSCVDGKEVKTACGSNQVCKEYPGGDVGCEDTCVASCDGDVAVECLNGKENRIDCPATFESGYTCNMIGGSPSCVPGACNQSCDGNEIYDCNGLVMACDPGESCVQDGSSARCE